MSSGVAQVDLGIIGPRVISVVFVSLLVTTGLLTSPVTCMCGAAIPHGHSLHQLPTHNHAGIADVSAQNPDQANEVVTERILSPMVAPDDECDDPAHRMQVHPEGYGYVALANVMEKQDGAVPQAPTSPSTGQPIAIAQPAPITVAGQQGDSLILPPTRVLEGLAPRPETPPPRATSI